MRLQLTNDGSALDSIMKMLDEFTAENEISEKAANQLRLCLEELVTNVLSYGYSYDAKSKIMVEVETDPDGVHVRLEDDGKPFNPFEEAAKPNLDASVEDREIGGLGVFFVTSLAREFRYRRENGRNVVDLKLDLH